MSHVHPVKDTDVHYKIDGVTRNITNVNETKRTLVQNDHNSERLTFELPRLIDGHDMTNCNVVQVHFTNADTFEKNFSKGVYDVDDLKVKGESGSDAETAIFTWLVSGKATKYVGTLNFVIRFSCVSGSVIEYAWNTATFKGITILEGIYNSDSVIEEHIDSLEQLKNDIKNETLALASKYTDDQIALLDERVTKLESASLDEQKVIEFGAQTSYTTWFDQLEGDPTYKVSDEILTEEQLLSSTLTIAFEDDPARVYTLTNPVLNVASDRISDYFGGYGVVYTVVDGVERKWYSTENSVEICVMPESAKQPAGLYVNQYATSNVCGKNWDTKFTSGSISFVELDSSDDNDEPDNDDSGSEEETNGVITFDNPSMLSSCSAGELGTYYKISPTILTKAQLLNAIVEVATNWGYTEKVTVTSVHNAFGDEDSMYAECSCQGRSLAGFILTSNNYDLDLGPGTYIKFDELSYQEIMTVDSVTGGTLTFEAGEAAESAPQIIVEFSGSGEYPYHDIGETGMYFVESFYMANAVPTFEQFKNNRFDIFFETNETEDTLELVNAYDCGDYWMASYRFYGHDWYNIVAFVPQKTADLYPGVYVDLDMITYYRSHIDGDINNGVIDYARIIFPEVKA